MVQEEVGIVFEVVDVIMVSLDLTGLFLGALGGWRGDVAVFQLTVFVGKVEDFVISRGEGNILGRAGRNDFLDLLGQIFYFVIYKLAGKALPFLFDKREAGGDVKEIVAVGGGVEVDEKSRGFVLVGSQD